MAPLLSVVTAIKGYDVPKLSWTDFSPTLTTGWNVYRARWVTGETAGVSDLTLVASLPTGTTTWTDSASQVKPGDSVRYVVTASLDRGEGPQSNAVLTGMRPAAPTGLTATGSGTNIALAWKGPAGATSYDIYRDSALVKTRVTGTNFTDAIAAYGHRHAYQVVAVNRYENQFTTGLVDNDLTPSGTTTTSSTYSGKLRSYSNIAQGFTAPAAPVVGSTATRAVPSTSTNAATVYWKPAAWSGAGTRAVATLDASWSADRHASTTTAWTAMWAKLSRATTSKAVTGLPWGDTTTARVQTCNPAGCGPYATVTALTVPPAPSSCSVSAVTTRSATITLVPAAMTTSSATAYGVTGGVAASGYSLAWGGATTSKVKTVDKLKAGVSQTFSATTSNSTGKSPVKTCTASTPAVQLTLSAAPSGTGTVAQKTRTIVAKATSSNASVSTPSIVRSSGSAGVTGEDLGGMTKCSSSSTEQCTAVDSWRADPLRDAVSYKVTASASDGVNTLSKSVAATTATLDAPTLTVGTRTTKSIKLSMTADNGDSGNSQLGLSGEGWQDGRSATFDNLSDDHDFTAYAKNSDGFNVSPTVSKDTSIPLLTAPSPTCSVSVTDATDPGTVYVSGGDQAQLSSSGAWYVSSHPFPSLPAGTYSSIRVRENRTDGYNVSAYGYDYCASVTIKAGKPAAPSCLKGAVAGGPGGMNATSLTWCGVNGAVDYEYMIETWSLTGDSNGKSAASSTGQTSRDEGGETRTHSTGMTWSTVSKCQWSLRAVASSGLKSDYSLSNMVYAP